MTHFFLNCLEKKPKLVNRGKWKSHCSHFSFNLNLNISHIHKPKIAVPTTANTIIKVMDFLLLPPAHLGREKQSKYCQYFQNML